MGRWAQAQRMGGCHGNLKWPGYSLRDFVNLAGYWELEWDSSSDPDYFEIEYSSFTGGIWVVYGTDQWTGSHRNSPTGKPVSWVLRARMKVLYQGQISGWTDYLYTP